MNEQLPLVLKSLEEANKVVSQLDPTIKLAAFERLSPFIFGAIKGTAVTHEAPGKGKAKTAPIEDAPLSDTSSMEAFFGQHTDLKAADNVTLIMAWQYSQAGCTPITINAIQSIADSVGLSVPARIDMTLRNGRRDGKAIFQNKNGGFIPTVIGEVFLKKSYGVKKGITASS